MIGKIGDLKENEKALKEKKRDFYKKIFGDFNKFPLIMTTIGSVSDLEQRFNPDGTIRGPYLSLSFIVLIAFFSYKGFRAYLKPLISILLSIGFFILLIFLITRLWKIESMKAIQMYLFYISYAITYITAMILTYRYFKKRFDEYKLSYSKFYFNLLSLTSILQITVSIIYNFVLKIEYNSHLKLIVFVFIIVIVYFIESKAVPYDENNIDKVEV
ncbi:hypothetical protein JXR93_03795 [bacterium]|nr:hypothetical protein [bacterium]